MAKIKLGAKHGKNSSWMDYARVLDAGEDFTTSGALEGGKVTPGGLAGWGATGRLPQEWRESANRADYVVWSYGTPIAWRIPGEGWVIPAVRYSATTSCHQGKIRTAVGSFAEGYREALDA